MKGRSIPSLCGEEQIYVADVYFSPDNRRVGAEISPGGSSRGLIVWDRESGQVVATRDIDGGRGYDGADRVFATAGGR